MHSSELQIQKRRSEAPFPYGTAIGIAVFVNTVTSVAWAVACGLLGAVILGLLAKPRPSYLSPVERAWFYLQLDALVIGGYFLACLFHGGTMWNWPGAFGLVIFSVTFSVIGLCRAAYTAKR
jgi:hypothetical protein